MDKVKEIEALRQRAAALEQEVEQERARELAALPRQYGFQSAEEFVDAVLQASGVRGRRRPGVGHTSSRNNGGNGRAGRRPRATITDEMRAQVKKLVEMGKTGAEIAHSVGISLPSVQNIKKALGLVTPRT